MQTLAFLWFESEVVQQRLRSTFAERVLAVKAQNWNSSWGWCFPYRILLRGNRLAKAAPVFGNIGGRTHLECSARYEDERNLVRHRP
jgi:hypothetical protein